MAAPKDVPTKNFQNTTFLQNPVSNMSGPRVPTENLMTNPTYSPALDASLRIRSRFRVLIGSPIATTGKAETSSSSSRSSSAFCPNNFSCKGWNTPNRNALPIQKVTTSLNTIPIYKAKNNFCCCTLAMVGHTAPANIHNASSDTGTPTPADKRATKYANGGVANALAVMVCNTAVAELPVKADFEKFFTIDIAPSQTVSGGGGKADIFNMVVVGFVVSLEGYGDNMLRLVTT
mmetsp:Transcript_18504/g.26135  ORF Transcript_18504/g.26135 Transcript_18504/m.26135 type:complete len:233 (-) Transcript_18504:327-1025(-)